MNRISVDLMNARSRVQLTTFVCFLAAFMVLLPVHGFGVTVHYNYDARNRLTGAVYDQGTDAAFTYDTRSNLVQKSITNSIGGNTAPNAPSPVAPVNTATNISIANTTLSWNGGDPDAGSTVTYDVYFGDSTNPALLQSNVTETSLLIPLTLQPETVYYWKVVAHDEYYLSAEGGVASFTTALVPPPAVPESPVPADLQTPVAYQDVTVEWTDPQGDAGTTYDLYFGTSTTPTLMLENSSDTNHTLGLLDPSTTYYWQVVARDTYGQTTTGPLWSFTTAEHEPMVLSSPVFSSNTTLTKAAGPYIISGSMTVNEGVVLALEPGTIFKMQPYSSIKVHGALIAQGTPTDKIIFTSAKNDQYGGDTNGDGAASSPAAGEWYGITFYQASGTTSTLSHTVLEYAGYANYGAVYAYISSPTIQDSLIQHNQAYGITTYGAAAPVITGTTIQDNGNYAVNGASGGMTLTNNTLQGGVSLPVGALLQMNDNILDYTDQRPSKVAPDYVGQLTTNNSFTNTDSSSKIEVLAGTVSHDATWQGGVPLHGLGTITVKGTDGDDTLTTLTLNPGVNIHMARYSKFIIGATSSDPGEIKALGTSENPILFTSGQATPAKGNWYGLTFYTTAAATSILKHTTVEYAGYANYGAVYTYLSSPTIQDSIIQHNQAYGVSTYDAAAPIITGTTIQDNGNYAVSGSSGEMTLTNNTIQGGVSLPAGALLQLSGNTFDYTDQRPSKVAPDYVGQLTANNSFTNTDSSSTIEVLAGTVSHDATWYGVLPLHGLGTITVKGTDGDDNLTTLTLNPGVTIRMARYSKFIIGAASGDPAEIKALGTSENPILFTSGQATPAKGDWYGITFNTTAADTSLLQYVIVEYGGYTGYGAVYTYSASPTLDHCTLRLNQSYGLSVYNGSPTVTNSIIYDNDSYGIYVSSGNPIIQNNAISNGIYLPTGETGTVSDNTINYDDTHPLRVTADAVGGLFSGNSFAGVTSESYVEVLSGTVSHDATWKGTIPLKLLGNITVKGTDGTDGVTTLTLEPGTELRFARYTKLVVGGTSGDPGAVRALGSEENHVRFTADQADPTPGYWYGVLFYPTAAATSLLDFATVEYGGAGNWGGVYTYGSAPTIRNSRIVNNSYCGVLVNVAGAPVLVNNTIQDNGSYGILVTNGQVSASGNTVHGGLSAPVNGINVIDGNTFDYTEQRAVKVPANAVGRLLTGNTFTNTDTTSVVEVVADTVSDDATWTSALPLSILGNITVKGTAGDDGVTTLTLEPGIELRFARYIKLIVGWTSGDPGALSAVGTASAPLLFTSGLETQAPGNWYGILFYTTALDSSRIEHATVEYGGAGNYGAVYAYGSSPTIKYSTLSNNSYAGVLASQGASPVLTYNSFVGNGNCGVRNTTASITVSAQNNWWGHATGPLDNSDDTASGGLYNPTGEGSCVSNYVNYSPWSGFALVDTDGDGLYDAEETTYGTDPTLTDTDGDGLADGAEYAYWGAAWNGDVDNDGIINLLDPDADDDSILDGVEVAQGSNQGSSTSLPATVVYEDSEDGTTIGWEVYDDDPTGSYVTNVYDAEKGDRVIEIYGDGLLNGHRLVEADSSWWNNAAHHVFEWSMKFSEDFVLSVAVQSDAGLRFLSYTPANTDALGAGTDIFHGLGTESKDGTWGTYIIDLEYDLKEAQPTNNINALLGFYVSGNGRVDDIKTHGSIPAGLDSDGDDITDNDEINTYGTHPYYSDSDGDGIEDGAELNYWGDDWNSDPDSDGLINLLDIDSDNDGNNDAVN